MMITMHTSTATAMGSFLGGTFMASDPNQVEKLMRSSDWAQWLYLIAVGIAVVVAGAVFFFQVRANLKLIDLNSAKDRQLASELKDKDIEIGKANERASQADERAAKADERAGKANEEAGKANERAGNLEVTAADLKRKNLETAKRLVEAQRQFEAERRERIEMEAAISPRVLADQNGISARLKKSFPGMKVKIYSLAENEAWGLAGQISCVAYQASWPVTSMGKFVNAGIPVPLMVSGKSMNFPIPFREGVEIGISFDTPFPMNANSTPIAENAANALIAELERNKIKARLGRAIEDIPGDTLVIIVGPIPTDYFDRNRVDGSGRGNKIYMNVVDYR